MSKTKSILVKDTAIKVRNIDRADFNSIEFDGIRNETVTMRLFSYLNHQACKIMPQQKAN